MRLNRMKGLKMSLFKSCWNVLTRSLSLVRPKTVSAVTITKIMQYLRYYYIISQNTVLLYEEGRFFLIWSSSLCTISSTFFCLVCIYSICLVNNSILYRSGTVGHILGKLILNRLQKAVSCTASSFAKLASQCTSSCPAIS